MKTKLAATGGATQTFVDDVFSTYLYTGNNSTQTITNGIDLAGKGGLVWIKQRNDFDGYSNNNTLVDTNRGVLKGLFSNTSDAQSTNDYITNFSSTGFTVGYTGETNQTSNRTYASWTFREAAKFFDVVTYTGTGTTAQNINHNLGSVPGCIIIKRTDSTSDWGVVHRSTNAYALYGYIGGKLNTAGVVGQTLAEDTGIYYDNSTYFTVDEGSAYFNPNASGGTYVAYLYAHDTSSTGIIQCGSFTTDGSGNATVNLGWEPQYLMNKKSSSIDNWQIFDQMRGFNATGATSALLRANLDNEEYVGLDIHPTATGFNTVGFAASATYIYMAIRRPNKPPTSGTQVFNTVLWTGNQTNNRQITGVGFNPDYVEAGTRNAATATSRGVVDRLRGTSPYLMTYYPTYEQLNSDLVSFDNDGITVDYISSGIFNNNSNIYGHFFKRASGFFDVVCYKGTGVSSASIPHNLGVVPELIIVKSRTILGGWYVFSAAATGSQCLILNLGLGWSNYGNPARTSTTFTVTSGTESNTSGADYVAYLFATLAGISKVGSYTGNGGTQNIDCGFAAGARFFLVKATSTTGSWWVWDSARGITSGNDPALQLNSTAAEITTADAVDPYSAGITVNQEATCSINASGVSYVYLAIS